MSSDRPEHGYDFPMHAADALAVLDAAGVGRASIVTASRGINSAVLHSSAYPARVERLVAVAPYVQLETKAGDSFWTTDEINEEADRFSAHGWRTDWPAFASWFMSRVFSEPDSAETIQELVQIALDASPEILIRTPERVNDLIAAFLLG